MTDKLTIAQIKAKLKQPAVDQAWLATLQADPRKGVQQALAQYHRRLDHEQQQQAEFTRRFELERKLWQQGQTLVAGVDEVGRGPLAGPVVAAAVILPHDFDLVAVNDSKQLTKEQRAQLYPQILLQARAVGVSVVDSHTIDKINIYEASRTAMTNAINQLTVRPDHLLIDAMEVHLPIAQTKLIKGDARSNSIAAASIVAKVFRDRLMEFYARLYPQYDWQHNDGYGTKAHLKALDQYGVTPLHRRSFAPVAAVLNK